MELPHQQETGVQLAKVVAAPLYQEARILVARLHVCVRVGSCAIPLPWPALSLHLSRSSPSRWSCFARLVLTLPWSSSERLCFRPLILRALSSILRLADWRCHLSMSWTETRLMHDRLLFSHEWLVSIPCCTKSSRSSSK